MYINPIVGGFLLCLLCEAVAFVAVCIAFAIKGGKKK